MNKDLTQEFIDLSIRSRVGKYPVKIFAGRKIDGLKMVRWINEKMGYEAINISEFKKALNIYESEGGTIHSRKSIGYSRD